MALKRIDEDRWHYSLRFVPGLVHLGFWPMMLVGFVAFGIAVTFAIITPGPGVLIVAGLSIGFMMLCIRGFRQWLGVRGVCTSITFEEDRIVITDSRARHDIIPRATIQDVTIERLTFPGSRRSPEIPRISGRVRVVALGGSVDVMPAASDADAERMATRIAEWAELSRSTYDGPATDGGM